MVISGRCAAGRGGGELQPGEGLRGGWPEDGSGCPPPPTAAESQHPLPESDRE